MTPIGSGSALFGLPVNPGVTGSRSSFAAFDGDFSSSLALQIATLKAQTIGTLAGTAPKASNATHPLDALSRSGTSALGALSGASGSSVTGVSLADPQSAYAMMSLINTADATYKAQYYELSQMRTAVGSLQQAADTLSTVDATQSNETIIARMQQFVDQYNAWIDHFEGTVQNGGVLAGNQAAEVSLGELEQNITSLFNGAAEGFHGMSGLGLTIDPTTHRAVLDTAKLNAALDARKTGAVATIDQFSANFEKSAALLNSDDNFIAHRLANLSRVIDYVKGNLTSLQSEFGVGASARLSPQMSQALRAYDAVYG